MGSQTIAIISPGDMGHSVGKVLIENGQRVITCLDGRSQRTRDFAAQAGIEDVPDLPALVTQADIILSILVPAQALDAAHRVADAVHEAGTSPLFVDCNAIAPQTTKAIAEIITGAGARYVDASIIGPPPRRPGVTRFYASGVDAGAFAALNDCGLDVRVISDEIGHGSAIKMCYAASTKGLTALYAELLTAAAAMGVYDALVEEFTISQPDALARMQRSVPRVPRKSRRFVGEMEEIASSFAAVGLTPEMLSGAADVYRLMGATALADVNPEDPAPPPELADALAAFVKQIAQE